MNGTISLLPLRVNSRHTNSIIAHVNVPFLILNLENSKSFVVSGAPWVYLFSVLSMMFAFLVWCIEGNLNGLFSLRNLNCWTFAINPWKSFLGSLGFFYYCLKASCCPIFAATTMWHSSDFLKVSVPAKNMVDKECWLFFSSVVFVRYRSRSTIRHDFASLLFYLSRLGAFTSGQDGVLSISTFPCELIGQFRYFKIQL